MKRLNRIFLVLGLVLFGFLVWRSGPAKLAHDLLAAGWGFLAVVAVAILSILLMTIGWGALLEPSGSRPSTWDLTGASLVAAALNFLVPGNVGGEPVKVSLLAGKVSSEDLVSTILLHNVMYWLSNLVLILFGVAMAALLLALPSKLLAVLVGASLLVALPTLGAAWLVHRRIAERFVRLLSRLGIRSKDPEELLVKAQRADELLRRFRSSHPRALLRGFAWTLAGRALSVLEVWVILAVMGYRVGPATAFLIQSTSLVVYAAFAFIPSQLGANEGASYMLFPYLGLASSTGVAMEMLRRLRVVVLVVLGLGLLAFHNLRARASIARSKA